MKNFTNKTVIVTGASSGIGEALARDSRPRGPGRPGRPQHSETSAHRGRNPRPGRGGRLLRRRRDPTRGVPRTHRHGRARIRRCRRAGLQCRALDAGPFRRCRSRRAAPLDGCQLLGHGQLLQVCAALSPGVERIGGRRLVGGRSPRPARPHGVFGFEVCHDRILGDPAYREPQEGAPCHDRLPGASPLRTCGSQPSRPTVRSRAKHRATRRR